MAEREVLTTVNLCDFEGNLNPAAVGWSRQPLHICNLSKHTMRKKRWNYWCVTTQNFLFSVTLSNLDYMGLAFVYFLDFHTKEFIEQTVMAPFGKGCDLPDLVNASVYFANNSLSLEFIEEPSSGVTLKVNSPNFGGKKFNAEISIVRPPDHETLNVVIPWSNNRFQFTSKQNCLPASGNLILGEKKYSIENEGGFACLDFGRGVWRYECFWNWASFSSPGLGINLGGRWTDGSGYTENGLTINGRLIKISDDVDFIYDTKNFMAPWKLQTRNSDQVALTFTPFYERIASTNFIILTSSVHQMIGRFSGYVIGEDGKKIEVGDVIGWAEDHHARW